MRWRTLGSPATPAVLSVAMALAAGGLPSCSGAGAGEDRGAVLRDFLVRDNQRWLGRDPRRVAEKYARMAADPYDFMRGTVGLFLEDVARVGGRGRTGFLAEPEACAVLLVGDPHPENFGTCAPGGGALAADTASLTLEWVDLDGAAFGPYLLDVRRAALGLAMALAGAPGCDAACRSAAIRSLAEGYADRISFLATGGTGEDEAWTPQVGAPEGGALVQALLDEAWEEGLGREEWEDATVLEGDVRRLRRDDALTADGRGALEPTAPERDQLQRLVASWHPAGEPGLRFLDGVRLYGKGVASLPAVRFLVLFDRGDPGPDDDDLATFREVVDPPPPPGLISLVPGLFPDNAARIVGASQRLWSRPDADARLAGLSDGGQAFKVVSGSSWFQELDHGDIAEAALAGEGGGDAARDLGGALGRALAAAHGRGGTAEGGDAAGAIYRDIGGRTEAFAEERARDAEEDLALTLGDFALLPGLLAIHGELLGADTLPDDVP
ncbi:DUF2252 domain-containing protein [Myxococcota bacterium]|nr:DUF2252 domain-containing protein [Myxococcota bacterium]